ncbi:hypothetical protein [Mycobacterium kyogaense]|uniref:hypothetical protein n=1 Tax=Mycobacterium kyogaense TaxID=2212479 RepID=UPI0013C46D58|nr:hypothetical protein [Mycobacterium kyogaense]
MTDAEKRAVIEELSARKRVGQGLSRPYARKWDVGGCIPKHSLWRHRDEPLANLASGLLALEQPLVWANDAVRIGEGRNSLWVAVNRSLPGEGPPDAYLLGQPGDNAAVYVGNAPEVIIEMIKDWSNPALTVAPLPELQVGFPAMEDRWPRYVGSWQWNIHGEARDEDVLKRAAVATVAAITKASA